MGGSRLQHRDGGEWKCVNGLRAGCTRTHRPSHYYRPAFICSSSDGNFSLGMKSRVQLLPPLQHLSSSPSLRSRQLHHIRLTPHSAICAPILPSYSAFLHTNTHILYTSRFRHVRHASSPCLWTSSPSGCRPNPRCHRLPSECKQLSTSVCNIRKQFLSSHGAVLQLFPSCFHFSQRM